MNIYIYIFIYINIHVYNIKPTKKSFIFSEDSKQTLCHLSGSRSPALKAEFQRCNDGRRRLRPRFRGMEKEGVETLGDKKTHEV